MRLVYVHLRLVGVLPRPLETQQALRSASSTAFQPSSFATSDPSNGGISAAGFFAAGFFAAGFFAAGLRGTSSSLESAAAAGGRSESISSSSLESAAAAGAAALRLVDSGGRSVPRRMLERLLPPERFLPDNVGGFAAAGGPSASSSAGVGSGDASASTR